MKLSDSFNHKQEKRSEICRSVPCLHTSEKPIKKVKPGMRTAVIMLISLSILLTGCTSQHEEEEEHTSTSEYTDIETEENLSTETHLEESDAENEMESTLLQDGILGQMVWVSNMTAMQR